MTVTDHTGAHSPAAWPIAALVAIAVAVSLGSALRLAWLDAAPLWTDELISAAIVDQPSLGALLKTSAQQLWPPLHYLVQRAVAGVCGVEAVCLRLPNAVAGSAAILATAALGGRLFGPWTGAAAAILIALSQAQISLARDGKGYGLILLIASLILLAASAGPGLPHPARRRPWRVAGWIGLVVAATAGLYTHDFFALMLASLFLALAILHRGDGRRLGTLVAAGAVIALAWAPWLLGLWAGRGHSLVAPPDWVMLGKSLEFLAGWLPALVPVQWAAVLLTGAAVLARSSLGLRAGPGRASGAVLLAVVLGTLALAIMLSFAVMPLLLERYLTVAAPAFTVVAAAGLSAPLALLSPASAARAAAAGLAAVLAVAVAELDPWALEPSRPAEGWAIIAHQVAAQPPAAGLPPPVVACTIGLPLYDRPLRLAGSPLSTDLLACHARDLDAAAWQALAGAEAVWLLWGHSWPDPTLVQALAAQHGPPVMDSRGAAAGALLFGRHR